MINPSVGQSLSQWSGTALSLSISKPIKSFINLMFTSYKWTTSDWPVIQRESGKKPLLIYSPLIDLSYEQTGIGRNFIQMCILYFHHDAWKFPNHCMPHPLSKWISNTSSHFIHLFWTADKLEQTALIALVHLKWSHSNRKHCEEGEICEKVAQQTGSSCEIVGWTQ